MFTKSIYLPQTATYTLHDADSYIRSAFTVPKSAIACDNTSTTGVLIVGYSKDGAMIAQFTCYPMSSYRP